MEFAYLLQFCVLNRLLMVALSFSTTSQGKSAILLPQLWDSNPHRYVYFKEIILINMWLCECLTDFISAYQSDKLHFFINLTKTSFSRVKIKRQTFLFFEDKICIFKSCNCNCEYDNLYSTVSSKLLLRCFTTLLKTLKARP